jgi:hypothetical protein
MEQVDELSVDYIETVTYKDKFATFYASENPKTGEKSLFRAY